MAWQGSTGIGPQGPKGDTGATGPAGPVGPGGDFTKIAEVLPTGMTVDFLAIPGTFRHLQLVWQARGDVAAVNSQLRLTANGDSGAHYSWDAVAIFAGASLSGTESLLDTSFLLGLMAAATATAGASGSGVFFLPNYAGPTFWKNFQSDSYLITSATNQNVQQQRIYGSWGSTSAVTSLSIAALSGNFVAGSIFSLYGLA